MKVRELILALSEYDGQEDVFFRGYDAFNLPEHYEVDRAEKDEDGDVVLREVW